MKTVVFEQGNRSGNLLHIETGDKLNREQKNSQAYEDVCDCLGPSMLNDPEYMIYYRFWWPLGAEASECREYLEED
jgi:hypothetical protein